jgi:hypothetical protein
MGTVTVPCGFLFVVKAASILQLLKLFKKEEIYIDF